MKLAERRRLFLYAALVYVGGGVALAIQGLSFEFSASSEGLWRFFIFAAFMFAGELFPIKLHHGAEEEQVTSSTTFSFGLLLIAGAGPAGVVAAAASIIADVRQRKSVLKMLFNASQVVLSLAFAAAILASAGLPNGTPPYFSPSDLPIILAAGVAFFLVNHLLMSIVTTLTAQAPLSEALLNDLRFQAATSGALLMLGPVVVVVSNFAVFLAVVFVIPLVAVHKAAAASVLKEYEAVHDALTGLPNRVLFHDRVEEAMSAANVGGHQVGVLMMDLDNFKEINDALGHQSGDRLLATVAARLSGVLRDSDIVARMGGDEFAILLPNIANAAVAEVVAKKLRKSLDQPISVEGLSLNVDSSIGIAVYPTQAGEVEQLVRRADAATRAAKEGRVGVKIYEKASDPNSRKRLALAGDLRAALAKRSEIFCHYQPKVDLRTNSIVGVEALARWMHPTLGLIAPKDFVPLAEQTGLIKPLTEHVLDEALGQVALWHKEAIEVNVAVNLSMRNVVDTEFPSTALRLLKQHGVSPDRLELELTESMFTQDLQKTIEVLDHLHALGIRLSIDDFGTGFSSLSRISRLPVDGLKIDRSFVMHMLQSDSNKAIVRATIGLAKNLGLESVAEGVESEEIFTSLRQMDCDVAQGFHISRPLPAQEMTSMFARSEEEEEEPAPAPERQQLPRRSARSSLRRDPSAARRLSSS